MTDSTKHKIFDQSLFEQLFKEHFGHLCNFARQYVEDADSAKDIVQKVFIRLWETREKIDLSQSITSYLFTSVKNRCLNHIRDHKKYRSRILDVDLEDVDPIIQEEEVDLEDLKEKIEKALDSLPEKCRQVFEMSRYQEMKYREIAEELEISQKTVEAHMSKALKTLRDHLKDQVFWLGLLLGIWGG